MARLGPNRYGKAEVRVVTVARGAHPDGGDVVRDRCVSTSLSGDLDATHLAGDNAHVLPTDTQKNAVHVLSRRLGDVEPEELALVLGRHLVGAGAAITRARIGVEEYPWDRLAGHAFARSGRHVRTVSVVVDEELGASVVAGIERLVVLATTNSEFRGFPRDDLTTLPEASDRILATEVTASWRYRPEALDGLDWATAWTTAHRALLEAFTTTYSRSLQQTLFAMGSAIVGAVPAVAEVRLALPNKHHVLADLGRFGETNPDAVYEAPDRPYGLIEGTVLADDAPDDPLAWS